MAPSATDRLIFVPCRWASAVPITHPKTLSPPPARSDTGRMPDKRTARSADYPHIKQYERMTEAEDCPSDSQEGEEPPSLRSPKGEGWCPRCGRRLRDRDKYGTYLCECGMAVTYGEGRPYEDDTETESAPHRPIRWVLVAIILLVMALVLAVLLFARRGPIPYGGDGDCFIGRDGSPECVIP